MDDEFLKVKMKSNDKVKFEWKNKQVNSEK